MTRWTSCCWVPRLSGVRWYGRVRIGVLRLIDDGDRDDKILAVRTAALFSDVVDLETFESRYPRARLIIETWFTNYKGPGRVTSAGFGDAAAAMDVVLEASQYYEENARLIE